MLRTQVTLAQTLHDRPGLNATILHRDAGAAHQVAIIALVKDFGQFTPQHGDGATIAVGRVDAGAPDFKQRPLQVGQPVKVELFFAVKMADTLCRAVIQQAGGGNQLAAIEIAYPDMFAISVIAVLVQPVFGAFEFGLQLVAEHTKTQGLSLAQCRGAEQTLSLQATFWSGVADTGDLGHCESPCRHCARSGYLPID